MFDPLGNVTAVHKRGALDGRPTETFEYRRDTVPNARRQRVRINHDDVEPGYEKVEYFDGCGRIAQVSLRAEAGRWAVGKQKQLTIAGTQIGETDAYFADSPAFTSAPPPGTATRVLHHDFAGRVVRERLFNGRETVHRYDRNHVAFYGPDAADQLAVDPATLPTRRTVLDAGGVIRSVFERDGTRWLEVRREHDAMHRLVRVDRSARTRRVHERLRFVGQSYPDPIGRRW